MKALLEMYGVQFYQGPRKTYTDYDEFPYLIISLDDPSILKEICQRSMTATLFLELHAHGKDENELIKNLDANPDCKEILDGKKRFAFYIDSYNCKMTPQEKAKVYTHFEKYTFGTTDLKTPEITYWFVKDFSENTKELKHCYFGTEIAKRGHGQESYFHKFRLPDRIYLGISSTWNELAFMMANQAKVKYGDVVYDPFAGTGSLLFPPTVLGATCFGSELDPKVLNGQGNGFLNKRCQFYKENKPQNVDVFSNFKQFGFPLPEIINMNALNNAIRPVELFDAIITDPPYGWRCPVTDKDCASERTSNEQKQQKTMFVNKMMETLYGIARKYLKKNGRMVVLYPLGKGDKFSEECLELDPKVFKMIDYSCNLLCDKRQRISVTIEKII